MAFVLSSGSTGAALDSSAEIYSGATFARGYQWLDNNLPVNITGATGESKFYRNNVELFSASVTVTDGPNGKFVVRLTPAQTGTQTPIPDSISGAVILRTVDRTATIDTYENIRFWVNLSSGADTFQIVRGVARFYP